MKIINKKNSVLFTFDLLEVGSATTEYEIIKNTGSCCENEVVSSGDLELTRKISLVIRPGTVQAAKEVVKDLSLTLADGNYTIKVKSKTSELILIEEDFFVYYNNLITLQNHIKVLFCSKKCYMCLPTKINYFELYFFISNYILFIGLDSTLCTFKGIGQDNIQSIKEECEISAMLGKKSNFDYEEAVREFYFNFYNTLYAYTQYVYEDAGIDLLEVDNMFNFPETNKCFLKANYNINKTTCN